MGLKELGYRLIAPDMPGFGDSPANGRKWRVSKVSDALIGLLDELKVDQVVAAGISMGGVVALDMAIRHPQRVEGLALINTFASLKPTSLSEWTYFLRRGFRAFLRNPAEQASIVAERVFPGEDRAVYRQLLVESIRKSDPRMYRQAMLELARVDLTGRLGNIHVPTLVISGAEDTTIPLKNQKELALRIPRAEHVIIPQAGHGVIADQPEAFNRFLSEFIERVKAGVTSIPATT